MDGNTRALMLKVMADDRRLIPFLFALNSSKFKAVVLNNLISRGCIGTALHDYIERRHFGDMLHAANSLTLEASALIKKLV